LQPGNNLICPNNRSVNLRDSSRYFIYLLIQDQEDQEWFIKYCSTNAGLQRYSGNVFTTNNITNSVMTAQWRGEKQHLH